MDKFDNIDKSKDYRSLIVDLIDKDGESIREIEFCPDFSSCYNNRIKFIENNEDLYLGLNYGSALLPSISRDYGSFFTGKAKVKVVLILTKEEIMKLKDIQVRFSD